ncbi:MULTISPECIES: viroplasmin family protein [unclassified Pseudomonas]|uniref:ribonuclease H1 domain-containing protein n=1 Tax=unclassified Pseudomonas TaxID=196821 RepID=UPI001199DD75|nr:MULTISPECIES: viroplasmin family protein [unclassified Pseudomonas]TWC18942.1 GIY-YIG catalytic domain-containing protein [Pseudomonas sp. SJZ075]TWC19514.1 GIY-YIG catalytic domain-containing protein [Pseudomonas sp. SJZ074]TWC33378.1 GIY-YIG catalytic domain-containing protein [Pseudomonas sp. SJZ078]TWC37660.1 GIY-YIG catalytic domain-containing protein [Pseudomonas sp. SJZ085]TWC55864.1 GIY-YIG catalytic domain-containing protein [Pseudomonas sp. SJZ124]
MAKKIRFYAVIHGRHTGIFDRWDGGARASVDHFPEAEHRSFRSLELAEEWYRQNTRSPRSNHSPVYHFNTDTIERRPTAKAQPELHDDLSKQYLVYIIIDPETEEPFYVGETGNFPRRQQAHIRSANTRTKRAAAKIAQILEKGQMPLFKAVEICESKDAALAAETQWIKRCVEKGHTVWNRIREHREIQELHHAPKIQMDSIIGDGPIQLGPYPYTSRFELKTKLYSYISNAPSGRVTHPVALEKLELIWATSKQKKSAPEFWIVPEGVGASLYVVRTDRTASSFDYMAVIDRIP